MKEKDLLYNTQILSERIEDLRKKDGKSKYTLNELSEMIEKKTGVYISAAQLGKYENSDIAERININNLMAIAKFYGVTLDFLLGKSNSKRHNYTDQMASNKFSLSDKSISKLTIMTNNKSFNNNEFKLKLINYIIENDNFLNNLSDDLLNFYKATDNKLHIDKKVAEQFNITRYTLSQLFEKFIDDSYKQLWNRKRPTLFDI